uniref:quinolinate synthase n=1 Tax=Chlamydomonas euryale TaxID=1486919 RepID=A0A7R9V9G1_9CHLO
MLRSRGAAAGCTRTPPSQLCCSPAVAHSAMPSQAVQAAAQRRPTHGLARCAAAGPSGCGAAAQPCRVQRPAAAAAAAAAGAAPAAAAARVGYSLSRGCGSAQRVTTRAASPAQEVSAESPAVPEGIAALTARFALMDDPRAKAAALLAAAKRLPPMEDSAKTTANRVMGCTAQVWVDAQLKADGTLAFSGASDSELSAGLAALLCEALSGLTPEQVLSVEDDALQALALGPAVLAPSRANGFANMLVTMKKRARALAGQLPPAFPSLLVTSEGLTPRGAFAQAQAQYLAPNPADVDRLASLLSEKKMGVVAHFYMDPEVQGVLMSAAERWPHIHISDSLVMADSAVGMAEAGCKYIAVLGVDFMSENVRAILDEAGHSDVMVYRMSEHAIGCSLAEAAESEQYNSYLATAGQTPNSLHVVYINTSLRTKATADSLLPTITCTSSNVVQTVLQAFAQVPDATVWYGPDTYMGRNLAQLFATLAELPDAEVAALHPAHTSASVKALLPRLHYYEDGTCIVHHIFGGETCDAVRKAYSDAYLTAHFEVPGEMFTLAMEVWRPGGAPGRCSTRC